MTEAIRITSTEVTQEDLQKLYKKQTDLIAEKAKYELVIGDILHAFDTREALSWKKAKKISGLDDTEITSIKSVLNQVNLTITSIVSKVGLVNEDGKIELGFDNLRRLIIVDVVGTLDECRFMYDGMHVSKQVLREFYKKTSWYNDVENAKRIAEEQNSTNWKQLCKSKPPKLDPKLINIVSAMYKATTNEITKKRLFDVNSISKTIENYKKYLGEKK